VLEPAPVTETFRLSLSKPLWPFAGGTDKFSAVRFAHVGSGDKKRNKYTPADKKQRRRAFI
jgi:hypothetical protein